MTFRKKLSRTECNEKRKTGEMTKETYDFLESQNLMTGSGRTFNSRVIENDKGEKVLLNKPSFRFPGGKKSGGGITCREPNWSDYDSAWTFDWL